MSFGFAIKANPNDIFDFNLILLIQNIVVIFFLWYNKLNKIICYYSVFLHKI